MKFIQKFFITLFLIPVVGHAMDAGVELELDPSIFHVDAGKEGSPASVTFGDKPVKDLTPQQIADIQDRTMPLEDQQAIILDRIKPGKDGKPEEDFDLIGDDNGEHVNLLVPTADQKPLVFHAGEPPEGALHQAAFLAASDPEIHSVIVTKVPELSTALSETSTSSGTYLEGAYAKEVTALESKISDLPKPEDMTEDQKIQAEVDLKKLQSYNQEVVNDPALKSKIQTLIDRLDTALGKPTGRDSGVSGMGLDNGGYVDIAPDKVVEDEPTQALSADQQKLFQAQVDVFEKVLKTLTGEQLLGEDDISEDVEALREQLQNYESSATQEALLTKLQAIEASITQKVEEYFEIGDGITEDDMRDMEAAMQGAAFDLDSHFVNATTQVFSVQGSGEDFLDAVHEAEMASPVVSEPVQKGWTPDQITMSEAASHANAAKIEMVQFDVVKRLNEFVDQYDTFGAQGKQQHIENLKQWLTLVKTKVESVQGVSFDTLLSKVEEMGKATTPKAQDAAIKDMRVTLSEQVKTLNLHFNEANDALEKALAVTGKDAVNARTQLEYTQMREQLAKATQAAVDLQTDLYVRLAPQSAGEKVASFFAGLKDTVKSWVTKAKSEPEGPTAVQIGDVNSAIETAKLKLIPNNDEISTWLYTGKEFTSVAEQAEGAQMLEAHIKALTHSISEVVEIKSQLDTWGAKPDDPVMKELDDLAQRLAGKARMYDANYEKAFQVDLYRLKIEVNGTEHESTIVQLTDGTQDLFDQVKKKNTFTDLITLDEQAQTLATGIEQLRSAGVHESYFSNSVDLHNKIRTYIEQQVDDFTTSILSGVDAAQKNTDPDAQLLSLGFLGGTLPRPDDVKGTVLESVVDEAYAHVYKAAGYDPGKNNMRAVKIEIVQALAKYSSAEELPEELVAFRTQYLTKQAEVKSNQATLAKRRSEAAELTTLVDNYRTANEAYQVEYKKIKRELLPDWSKIDPLQHARITAEANLRSQALDMRLVVAKGGDGTITIDTTPYTKETTTLKDQASQLVTQQLADLQAQSTKVTKALADLPTLTADSPGAKQVNGLRATLEGYKTHGIVGY